MFNLTTKPVSAGELMKKEKKPINFVVDKFISQGVHFLAGHPKWLYIQGDLVLSVGVASRALGYTHVTARP